MFDILMLFGDECVFVVLLSICSVASVAIVVVWSVVV